MEEGLLFILAIAYLLLPLFLLFSHLGLKKEVKTLRESLEGLSTNPKPVNKKESPSPTPKPSAQAVPPQKLFVSPTAPSWVDELMHWLKIDWPMKTGAFLLLLGFGWLTTYAFLLNWIGPVGRISLGIGSGVVILLLGEWRSRKSVAQGSVLVALGAAILLVTTFAARSVYNFFNPATALVFMALIVAFVDYASVKRRVFSLSMLGLIMGSAAPLLVDSPDINFIGLFSYLLILCLGTLWVVNRTGWRVFNNLALAVVAFYSFAYLDESNPQERVKSIEFAFASGFALIFLTSNGLRMLRNKVASENDLVTAAGNGLLFLFWIHQTIAPEWKSLVTAAAMLFFFVTTTLLFRKTNLKEGIYVYGFVAFVFLVAASRFEIQNDTAFFLAYTLEALSLTVFTLKTMQRYPDSRYACVVLLPAAISGLPSLTSSTWGTGIAHLDFALILTNAVALLSLGVYATQKKWQESSLLIGAGSFYAVALVWLSADALIVNSSMSVMAALIIYTVTGLILNVRGNAKQIPLAKTMGAILIGLVVIRLLSVDIWNMDITGKIVTFFVIGSLLISTAFLNKSKTPNPIQ